MREDAAAQGALLDRYGHRGAGDSIRTVAHLLEIAVWAVLFVRLWRISRVRNRLLPAVNYTTLGYGDVIMTPSWRLLGLLEAMECSCSVFRPR